LRPDPTAARDAGMRSLVRGAICIARAASEKTRPSELARQWADDRGLDLVLRAAVSPTSVAGTPALSAIAVALLETLIPQSAGAALLARGLGLNFDGAAQINVPGVTTLPVCDFVGEGAPIPVVMAPAAGPSLTPHKIAVITTLTNELLRSSNAEDLLRQVLLEALGPALDKQLFGTTAGDAIRPPGLRYNIAGLTPTAAGPAKSEVLVDDLQLLAAAIAPVSGNGNVALVASPDAAAALKMRLPSNVEWPVLTSSSLAARTVIAIAATALASAIEGTPQIDASPHAEIHRESVPGEIVDIGGIYARPVGSIFQTDEVALRLRWNITWALRSSAGLAWMTGVNW
jgi:hypothetical protein